MVIGSIVLTEGSIRRLKPLHDNAPPPFAVQMVKRQSFDGLRLVAWLAQPPVSRHRCVMVLHGVYDDKAAVANFAPMFLEQGYTVLMPDSRAHGASEGDLITFGVKERLDVRDWANYLATLDCQAGIFGLGESLGGAVLLQSLAASANFRALAVEGSYATFEGVSRDRVAHYAGLPLALGRLLDWPLVETGLWYARLRYGVDLAEARPIDVMEGARVPIFLIHGLADHETEPEHTRRLARANRRAHVWFPVHAGHCQAYASSPEEFKAVVLDWFDQASMPVEAEPRL